MLSLIRSRCGCLLQSEQLCPKHGVRAPTGEAPVERIIAYESGELSEDATVALFQELIDSGLAWQLQGSYGRTAQRLIDAGLCWRERVE